MVQKINPVWVKPNRVGLKLETPGPSGISLNIN